ncbi:MAG TPA: hypothetical protein PLX18_00680 [Anaerohalosphaeraceae bacterium]|nr:hypothetical protein [Anaerohalosphaeraceae bacterium]HQG04810.1 hypothetical protein [Anaerohalosphaeraceae bacterium]HQI06360.1 hypothetical protein [Anaerohalosphaeraceae bacterium]HQJ66906.1 hypothetical protein [Anaerohalosphaeraceae bacterium]
MRKVLPILLAIALAMPALADVAVTVDDAGDGVAQLNLAISGDAVVRGLALKVTITGAELAAIADVTDVMPAFNAYIDYYYSNTGFLGTLGDETDLPGTGAHALADPDAAGVLAVLPATTFSISLGALDNSGSQGGVTAGGVLAKINLSNFSGSAQVCVEADALRGGIVGDNLGTVDADDCGAIAAPSTECVSSTAPFYADWVAFGKPACWCYAANCKGDADGLKEGNALAGYRKVYTGDLNILLSAYDIKEPPKGPGIATIPNGICADFDRTKEGNALAGYRRVYTGDLNILLANYDVKEPPKGPGIGDCAGPNYNFFVTP